MVFRSAADPAVQPFAGPPGQWRLLLPAFIGWGAIAIAIGRPGHAGRRTLGRDTALKRQVPDSTQAEPYPSLGAV